MKRGVFVAVAISTAFVLYLLLPDPAIRTLPYSHLFLSDTELRSSDWFFLPHAAAAMAAMGLVYGRHHSGVVRYNIVGFAASLPVSLLYVWIASLILRVFRRASN